MSRYKPLFASSSGVLALDTLSRRVSELAVELGGPSFLFRDRRHTCETEMAALGFSVDLRAQLLSHGLGGIQAKHYDKHGYMPEKQAALEAWERHLEGQEQPATGATWSASPPAAALPDLGYSKKAIYLACGTLT